MRARARSPSSPGTRSASWPRRSTTIQRVTTEVADEQAVAAAQGHRRHLREPGPPQPGAARPPDRVHRPARGQRGRPRPAREPVPARPPRHPHAPQRRVAAGAGRRRPAPAAGPAGRRWPTWCGSPSARSRTSPGSTCWRSTTSAVAANVAVDLAHLLAELMENATQFSPPETLVEVVGHRTRDGAYVLSVSDQGIGMSAEQLAEANQQLAHPPLMGLALSRSLGFIVIGRLAARHGIAVRLTASPSGGVTALVTLPAGCSPTPPVARRRARRRRTALPSRRRSRAACRPLGRRPGGRRPAPSLPAGPNGLGERPRGRDHAARRPGAAGDRRHARPVRGVPVHRPCRPRRAVASPAQTAARRSRTTTWTRTRRAARRVRQPPARRIRLRRCRAAAALRRRPARSARRRRRPRSRRAVPGARRRRHARRGDARRSWPGRRSPRPRRRRRRHAAATGRRRRGRLAAGLLPTGRSASRGIADRGRARACPGRAAAPPARSTSHGPLRRSRRQRADAVAATPAAGAAPSQPADLTPPPAGGPSRRPVEDAGPQLTAAGLVRRSPKQQIRDLTADAQTPGAPARPPSAPPRRCGRCCPATAPACSGAVRRPRPAPAPDEPARPEGRATVPSRWQIRTRRMHDERTERRGEQRQLAGHRTSSSGCPG